MMLEYFTIGGITLDDTVLPDGKVQFGAPGGNAVYSAIGARVWSGQAVGIVGRVDGQYPQQNLDSLAQGGLDTRGIRRIDSPGLHVWILYERSGHRRIIPQMDSGDSPEVDPTPDDIPPDYLQAKYAHVSCMAPSSEATIARFLMQQSVPFCLDISQESIPNHPEGLSDSYMLEHCDVFLPSIGELDLIWGRQPLRPLLDRIAEFGPKVIAVKVGELGSFVFERRTGRLYHVPAARCQVLDTTGAGDGYCGGFMVGYAETGDVVEAACRGNVSASFVIQDFGALHALMATRAEAEHRCASLRSGVELVLAQDPLHR